MGPVRLISSTAAPAGSRWSSSAPSVPSCSVPRPSACGTTSPSASTATTSRKDARSRFRSSVPRALNSMAAPDETSSPDGYGAQLGITIWQSFARLVRPPHSRPAAEGARRLRRQLLTLNAVGIIAVLLLIFGFDATEIALMPPRGSPSMWWARLLTDFGKDVYVLECLLAAMVTLAIIAPLWPQASRGRLRHFGTQVLYLFFAVLVPVICAQVLKWVIGRGRPFVSGKDDAFNFVPFTGANHISACRQVMRWRAWRWPSPWRRSGQEQGS